MKPSITLGRLFGVDVGLHYSWFIIALLITLSLAGHFGATDPDWSHAIVASTPVSPEAPTRAPTRVTRYSRVLVVMPIALSHSSEVMRVIV